MTVFATPNSQSIIGGMPFWRLQISNWGNVGTGADANSVQYVDGPVSSAQYVVIGPDSTADEVVIGYDDNALAFGNTGSSPLILGREQFTIGIVRPGAMLPGPLTVIATIATRFGDVYFKDGDPAAQPFGLTAPRFQPPEIQLLFYNVVPSVPTYTKRSMLHRTVFEAAGAVGVETLFGIWPVMGRSCKSVYFRATGTAVASVRVGGITASRTVGPPLLFETTVATNTINANTGVNASISTDRPMQWLAAYATTTAGAGAIQVEMTAQDC